MVYFLARGHLADLPNVTQAALPILQKAGLRLKDCALPKLCPRVSLQLIGS